MFALTRSMLGLIVASFLLVSAPLIAAVISSFVNVTGLSRQADAALARGVEIAQISQAVVEEIHGMERNVRQYSVLGDADFLKFYQDRQQRLEANVTRLEDLVGTTPATSQLVAVRTQSRAILDQVTTATKPEERAAAVERFEPLQAAAASWVTSANEIIGEESARLHASARDTRDRVTRLLITTIPAALLMILLFTFLIVRPVRQLGRAIREIGVGGKGNAIRVRGPADLAALGRELEALRLRLAATEQEKQIFLRHMSHELKTPLANLLEGTELLTDGSLGNLQDAQAEVSGILRGNAQELRHLIENLLDYSAWQEKNDRVERSDFELQVLCQQVLEQYRLTLLGKNVVVDQRIIPMRVSADREKLKTVLSNLISNAIKYSPQGGTVHLRALRLNGQLVFDVADAGPNVPVAERERIFEPFYTGAPPRQSHVRGTGIGLSLVREYVRAHGGQIELVDGVYSGAHFRLTLPLTTNGYAEPNTL
jgi:two-component system sensor histidine kinase GlrK